MELDAPSVGELEKQYLSRMIDTGFVSTFGPFVTEFEEKIAQYLDVRKAVSTQSGTAALHVALHEAGIGVGDEVIVPALTFVATVNPIVYRGATSVFADVDKDTYNIDPQAIEKAITEKTRAIIPVHLYGNPCNMGAIKEIANKYKLIVIEDAAESLGARYNGKFTATIGDFGCLSFNGNKTITTGGGGMVVSDNVQRINHIKFLVNQARDESMGYYHPEVGFNYRMTNIEAALGLAQMEKLKEFLEKKRLFNRIYEEELTKIRSITFQKPYENAESSCWLTCILLDKRINILDFQKALKDRGIPTRRVFMPITEFPPYKKNRKESLDNTYEIYDRGLCLPSSTLNSENDVHHVCKSIKELL
jgi:perosamine synthetase